MGLASSRPGDKLVSHLVAQVVDGTIDAIQGYQDTSKPYQEKLATVKLCYAQHGTYEELLKALLNAHDLDRDNVDEVRLTYTVVGAKQVRLLEIGRHTVLHDLITDEDTKFVFKITKRRGLLQTEKLAGINATFEDSSSGEEEPGT